jgi:phosphoribosyl 1,2-cyclic phosphodiesterase
VKGIRFWGTRGSHPAPLTADDVRRKIITAISRAAGQSFGGRHDIQAFADSLGFAVAGTYGGHTACVELATGGDDHVLCDLGSGVRPFAKSVLERHGASAPQTYHVFMSHLHRGHVMGLPFFKPAFMPGNRVCFYGGHADLEAALRRQLEVSSFRADPPGARAELEFVRLKPDRPHQIAGMAVTLKRQRHPGDSFGYRFESAGRTVVYSTDAEHDLGKSAATGSFAEFFRNADVVIFDAMYSLAEESSVAAGSGHSNNVVGVELCQAAGARQLVLFHHNPDSDDETLTRVLEDTRRLEEITRKGSPLLVTAAYDGMSIPL